MLRRFKTRNKREVPVGWNALLLTLVRGGDGSRMGTSPAPAPAVEPSGGTYRTPLNVTICDSLPNATIYVTYGTMDGAMPTLSPRVYRGPSC